MKKIILLITVAVSVIACSQKEKADLLVYNATIYTVDSTFTTAEAMAVKDGKIVAIGKSSELAEKYDAKEKIDAGGKFIYPGFIDCACAFYRLWK
jgi:predicted amidohydrolase YtcJ